MSKRLRRLMRQGRYAVAFDRDFEGVIKACAGKREGRWHPTWITPRMMAAFAALYDAGNAHSFEVWNEDGALVGSGYGVAIGTMFFTESQFSLRAEHLEARLLGAELAFGALGLSAERREMVDAHHPRHGLSPHPRQEFLGLLAEDTGHGGRDGRWAVEASPDIVAGWNGAANSAAEDRG
jgi:leucyl/phenylalanyl-tRNA--protein transferase